MKSRDVFVEIYRKEINCSFPSLESLNVATNIIVKVVGGLGGERSDLFVTSSVSGDEEDGNTFDLENIS